MIKKHKRYTLAVTLYRRSDTPLDLLKRLLDRGDEVGLRLKRLYLDRGFDNNGVVDYLKDKPFPTILPLVVRGAKGGSRKLMTGRKSRQTTYTRQSQKYGALTLPLVIVCKYSKGRYKRHGLCRFAYVVIGQLSIPPLQVFEESLPLCHRSQLSHDEYRPSSHHFEIRPSASLLDSYGLSPTQPLGLCQVAFPFSATAGATSGSPLFASPGSLASLALESLTQAWFFFVYFTSTS